MWPLHQSTCLAGRVNPPVAVVIPGCDDWWTSSKYLCNYLQCSTISWIFVLIPYYATNEGSLILLRIKNMHTMCDCEPAKVLLHPESSIVAYLKIYFIGTGRMNVLSNNQWVLSLSKGVSLVVTKPFVTVPLTLQQMLAICLTQEGFKSLAQKFKSLDSRTMRKVTALCWSGPDS